MSSRGSPPISSTSNLPRTTKVSLVGMGQVRVEKLQKISSDCRHSALFGLLVKLKCLCQIFGVLAVSGRRTILRRVQQVWCLIILGFVVVVNYLTALGVESEFSLMRRTFTYTEFVLNSVLVTVILWHSFHKDELRGNLFHRLDLFYTRLQPYYRIPNPRSLLDEVLLREVRLIGLSLFLFMALCFVVDWFYCDFDVLEVISYSGAYNLPNVMNFLYLSLYVLALRSLRLFYRAINDVLNVYVDSVPDVDLFGVNEVTWYQREFFSFNHKRSEEVEHLVSTLTEIYGELDQLLAEIVDAFGAALLLNFLLSFFVMVMNFFVIYLFFDNPNEEAIFDVIASILWLTLHTGRLFFMLLPSNAIIDEKCGTIFLLNALPVETVSLEVKINHFLKQLMIRGNSVSVGGIIDLDLLILGGITEALATYVIFLIQINLSHVSIAQAHRVAVT